MKYEVVLTSTARRQAKDAVQWWARYRSKQQAERWYDQLFRTLSQLQTDPERFPLARESADFPFELREMTHGLRASKTHRILFGIDNKTVTVFAIRYVAQDDVSFDDL